MEELKQRILKDGIVLNNSVIKVDKFLNHQLDITLLDNIGSEFYHHFMDQEITKILTIEASGIAVATLTALYFNVPVVFARKSESITHPEDKYSADVYSFTHEKQFNIFVSREYLKPGDKILVIDDFLANGQALLGMARIVHEAGATLVGAGIVIEKSFQDGGKLVRDAGINVFSLARIKNMSDSGITFL
ncbi:MAG: xanthine phosphoribosyltransferase [Marinilabiliales bacterium]|nr:MAG: xanthine phosphoribosyltransferase [Marinilabiliales bacterium]